MMSEKGNLRAKLLYMADDGGGGQGWRPKKICLPRAQILIPGPPCSTLCPLLPVLRHPKPTMEQAMETDWTSVPFNLLPGNPFSYSPRSISATSATEAFITGIDLRDKGRCVVCGFNIETALKYVHIVAKVEHATVRPLYSLLHVSILPLKTLIQWEEMRDRGFIPRQAKSVAHEARNGVLMCKNHQSSFEGHLFYIRWVPEVRYCPSLPHSHNAVLTVQTLLLCESLSSFGVGGISWSCNQHQCR